MNPLLKQALRLAKRRQVLERKMEKLCQKIGQLADKEQRLINQQTREAV